ncbi:MAG: permease, partial [Chlamydiia bacterium]|nr:permease [Chlamydiia bacterium]
MAVFRALCLLFVVFFMGMLYWSSLVLEETMRQIRKEIKALQVEIDDLSVVQTTHYQKDKKEFVVSDRPNLVEPDPFDTQVLPTLLPAGFKPKGTLVDDVLGKPVDLSPFSGWAQNSVWQGLCVPRLVRLKFGRYETYAEDLAYRVEERMREDVPVPEFWVYLRPGVMWQPLQREWFSEEISLDPHFLKPHEVTAHDVKFWFDAMRNPHNQEMGAIAMRTIMEDLESVEVIDDHTFVARWRPHKVVDEAGGVSYKISFVARQLTGGLDLLPRFVYQYYPNGQKIVEDDAEPNTYQTHAVWAQQFARHWARNIIIGCGSWYFDGKTDEQVRFRRNPDHYFPLDALAMRSEYRFKDSTQAIWQSFIEGVTDTYVLSSAQLMEYEQFMQSPTYKQQKEEGKEIHRLDYLSGGYNYIGWNEANPLFQSKEVRQALTLAIDRERIIKQLIHGMGVQPTSPIRLSSPSNNPNIQPWPFNPLEAKRLLKANGWQDTDGDGILEKEIDGVRIPFRFKFSYYVKSPIAKAIGELIATSLKGIGIDCQLWGVDLTDLSQLTDDKDFDAIMLGWSSG